LKKPFIL